MSKLETAFATVLDTLAQATLAVNKANELDQVLQQIANAVRDLIGSEYAAIGIPSDDNLLDIFIFSGLDSDVTTHVPHLPKGLGLLGSIVQERLPVRVSRTIEDPRSVGFPPSHPPMHSFLGVPIFSDEEIVGILYLTNKIDMDAFSVIDQKLAEMLAAHASTAIRKSRLLQSSVNYGRLLETKNRQLAALSEAAMSIAGEHSLQKVLQQIVDAAKSLVEAQYAALGVPNAEGVLTHFIYNGLSREEAARLGGLPHGLGLLGAIIKEKRTIRLPRIGDDPRSVGFPEGHPPMESFLGVPIMAAGETLGNLYLTNKLTAVAFTQADQEIVELLAAHAGIAIQNARLYEQVGRLAILEERTRIGMDLHDGVIQSIYAVGLTLESTRLSLADNPEEASQLLDIAVSGLNDAIRDIRNFILDLRPRRFGGDLEQGLGRLVREFQANTMVNVSLSELPPGLSGLPTAVARTIFLTTQGALANVARHARAKNVSIELQHSAGDIILAIQDDGRGFDVRTAHQAIGHGLSNMLARAEELNGRFGVQSAPGQGTRLVLTLPWR